MKAIIEPQFRSQSLTPDSAGDCPSRHSCATPPPAQDVPAAATPPVADVLVIESSCVVRKRLCALIEETGSIRVVGEAASAFEGWFLFRSRRPDAVVLDMHLPVISGLAVLRRIKALSPDCPVILFTNFADAHSRAECRRSGADCFLHKATQFEQVIPAILRSCAGRVAH
jgi:DNA-binding NarL/FixJ family response regulator